MKRAGCARNRGGWQPSAAGGGEESSCSFRRRVAAAEPKVFSPNRTGSFLLRSCARRNHLQGSAAKTAGQFRAFAWLLGQIAAHGEGGKPRANSSCGGSFPSDSGAVRVPVQGNSCSAAGFAGLSNRIECLRSGSLRGFRARTADRASALGLPAEALAKAGTTRSTSRQNL